MSVYLKNSKSVTLLASFSDVICKSVKLLYSSNTLLSGTVSVPSRYNGGVAIATMIQISGSPYNQVQTLYVSEISNNLLTVYAKGSGFVNGHILQVNVLISH